MRDRMERFLVLPFTIGCASETSLAVPKSRSDQPRKQQVKKKTCFISFLDLSKPNISSGILRLIQSIKSFSQIFVFYEEDVEEIEKEIEIGFPTDVKHVTHIGLDGSRTTNPFVGWENLDSGEVMSFPSISAKQFELAMVLHSYHQHHNVELKA